MTVSVLPLFQHEFLYLGDTVGFALTTEYETCGLFPLIYIYENLISMQRLTGRIALLVSVKKRLSYENKHNSI